MSEQLYERTVPFFGQSLLVCEPKRMERLRYWPWCLHTGVSSPCFQPWAWEFFTPSSLGILHRMCCRDTPDYLHKTPASIPFPKAASKIRTKSFSHFRPLPDQQLWMGFVLNKGCSSLVYFNHHEEVLLFKYQLSPLMSHQHFSPCLWGTLSKWANQALVCPSAVFWQADSHLARENWSSVAAEVFPPGRLELHLSLFTLSGSWAQWQLLKSCQAEKQNLLWLLVSLSAMWLFIKGLFRLRKIRETKRLAEFEKFRVTHCLTLDNYWITNE